MLNRNHAEQSLTKKDLRVCKKNTVQPASKIDPECWHLLLANVQLSFQLR